MHISRLPTSLKWRSETQQRLLACQVASLLLQRYDPIRLLESNPNLLPSPLPSPLFLRILTRIRSHPQTSLLFFNFARSHLNFEPDIHSVSKLILLLLESGAQSEPHQILEPFLRSHTVHSLLDLMVRAASYCKNSQSRLLSFVLQSYSVSLPIPNCLETFKRVRDLGCVPSTTSCNQLLDALCQSDRFNSAWVCHAVLIRSGFEPNGQTWGVVSRILCRQGKLKVAEMLLGLGFCGTSSYELVIDCHCRRGDFRAAVRVLNEMHKRDLIPILNAYASFIDGGCRFGDAGVINLMLKEVIVKGLIPMVPALDYDWVISKLCELKKTFAAKMFFGISKNSKVKLRGSAYESFIRALAEVGRVKEAIEVYKVRLREGSALSRRCGDVLLSAICKAEPSDELDTLLKDLVVRGFVPTSGDLSIFLATQCDKGRWGAATDILNIVLEKGVLLNEFCCCSLVKHYCLSDLVDSAVMLHKNMEKLGGRLDVVSYNTLLEALFVEKRVEEAIQVFKYMKEKRVLSSASFVIMIASLCREKELRMAMRLHDEMLKMGCKPDDVTYRGLISGFV